MSESRRAVADDGPPEDPRLRDAQEELHELVERRGRSGTAAKELELRALANQTRAAYSALLESLESAATEARRLNEEDPEENGGRGTALFRQFLMNHWAADVHLVGRAGPVARWYLQQCTRSPVRVNRLLRAGAEGALERARLCAYVEQHVYRPGVEALLRQLGGDDQGPRAL